MTFDWSGKLNKLKAGNVGTVFKHKYLGQTSEIITEFMFSVTMDESIQILH